jgi:hypothetical protein
MSALSVVGFHSADPVDQVLNWRGALWWVHLINLDRRAAFLASAALTPPPPRVTSFSHQTSTPDPPPRPL